MKKEYTKDEQGFSFRLSVSTGSNTYTFGTIFFDLNFNVLNIIYQNQNYTKDEFINTQQDNIPILIEFKTIENYIESAIRYIKNQEKKAQQQLVEFPIYVVTTYSSVDFREYIAIGETNDKFKLKASTSVMKESISSGIYSSRNKKQMLELFDKLSFEKIERLKEELKAQENIIMEVKSLYS